MLNIIEPKDHHLHTSKISSLLNFLKIYQKFSLLPEEKETATFIIAENEKFGVYRGAVVYLKDVKRLYHKLAAPLLEFLPKKEQIWCVRLCFSADQDDRALIKKLDIDQKVMRQLEKPDAKGSIFCKHAQDLAQALGCQIHYTFISEKPINKKIRSPLAQLWGEQREYILCHPKPPEGWFRYLRNSLGLSISEVSKKIGIEESIIIQTESDEKNDRIIKESMRKLIQALGL